MRETSCMGGLRSSHCSRLERLHPRFGVADRLAPWPRSAPAFSGQRLTGAAGSRGAAGTRTRSDPRPGPCLFRSHGNGFAGPITSVPTDVNSPTTSPTTSTPSVSPHCRQTPQRSPVRRRPRPPPRTPPFAVDLAACLADRNYGSDRVPSVPLPWHQLPRPPRPRPTPRRQNGRPSPGYAHQSPPGSGSVDDGGGSGMVIGIAVLVVLELILFFVVRGIGPMRAKARTGPPVHTRSPTDRAAPSPTDATPARCGRRWLHLDVGTAAAKPKFQEDHSLGKGNGVVRFVGTMC